MPQRTLITAALPYANGSIHLGHIVEYTHADMYTRALKLLGHDAIFVCANDAHGTPIELKAKGLGISPLALVQKFHEEHKRDFAAFGVHFDNFGITHSDTNKAITLEFYEKLKSAGMLDEREMDGNWCETDKRFLPDRFIKGTCPRCKTPDQYGDVCENCGATYTPADLINSRCVLCGSTPIVKKSTHLFYKLRERSDFLKGWTRGGALQDDVANFVGSWLTDGLQDWCVTRDGPYFGFEVPDRPGKYFYVWLDAPIGYIASSSEWAAKTGTELAELWNNAEATRIEHIIGKDIVYFHALFWPAVLKDAGYTVPSKVHVHGMLTVDGEKMSKSRGTFIQAATFAEYLEPEALRYYFASKLSNNSDDIDLSLDDFVARVNAELVNKHANLFSRVSNFLNQKLDSQLGPLPFTQDALHGAPVSGGSPLGLAQKVLQHADRVEAAFAARQMSTAVREICAIADIGNEFMQTQKPWDQLKTDPEAARATCTFVVNVCEVLAAYLSPIVPNFSKTAAEIIDVPPAQLAKRSFFQLEKQAIGPSIRLFDRIDKKQIRKLIDASKDAKAATSDQENLVDIKDFQKIKLVSGRVKTAQKLEGSDKLLLLQVDVGEDKPRQIVSGIAHRYTPDDVKDKTVVVVANLKPARLRGQLSEGMILAAGDGDDLSIVEVDPSLSPGTAIR